jgi:signal transduction histidine kinase
LDLTMEVPDKLPLINGDEWRIGQVMGDLINNAIKFTDKGKITIRAKEEGDNIKVEIEDTGIGISKENISKMFTKFFQVETGADRKYEGTGLGLVIAKMIIEAHKGKIWIDSKLEKGSKFIFTLPISKDQRIEIKKENSEDKSVKEKGEIKEEIFKKQKP